MPPETPLGLNRLLPIETERLVVRGFRGEDADSLFELHRSPYVTRYAGGTKTRVESQLALERLIQKVRTTGFGALAVEEKATRATIGWCGIQPMRDIDEFEVTYALAQRSWGHGLAYEAAYALILQAFLEQSIALQRLRGLVFPQNVRSIRVLEKLGMKFLGNHFDEATKRHACLYGVEQSAFLSRHYSSSK